MKSSRRIPSCWAPPSPEDSSARSRGRVSLCCALTFACATGCGGIAAGEDVERLQQPIVDGIPSTYAGVVALSAGTGNVRSGCSATLIAPDVVLTALHCVSHFDDVAHFWCRSDGSLDAMPPAGEIGATVAPHSVEIRAAAEYQEEPSALGVRVFGSGSTQICRHDIAVVVLDRELAAPVTALRDRETKQGERMRVIGYGTNDTELVSRYERAGLQVLDVGAVSGTPATGAASPNTFVLGEGGCRGDSGGPAISEETGAIAGVYSIAAGVSCTAAGVRNVYTLVAPFREMITEALHWAGREPVWELGDEREPVATPTSDAAAPAPPSGSGSRREPVLTCAAAQRRGGPTMSGVWGLVLLALALRRVVGRGVC